MMIGNYPCCDGDLFILLPDETPKFAPENCPHCGAKVWHKFSRIDPQTWMEADFMAEFYVDEENRTIKARK